MLLESLVQTEQQSEAGHPQRIMDPAPPRTTSGISTTAWPTSPYPPTLHTFVHGTFALDAGSFRVVCAAMGAGEPRDQSVRPSERKCWSTNSSTAD